MTTEKLLDAIIIIGVAIILLLAAKNAYAEVPAQWVDAKCCVMEIKRDADGSISRSSTAIKYFKQQNPCPSTGLTFGPCPGYSVDHIHPLAKCGFDHPTNMQWLKNTIKSCAGTECKDRWELNAYKCQ